MKIDKLKGNIPDKVLLELPSVIEKFKIDTSLKLAHFLAQCAHESIGFTAVSEHLSYSAEALGRVFGKRFNTPILCNSYAHKPEAIASLAYHTKNGNGDEASKDGWKFRGRGYIQLTGRANYSAFSKFAGEDVVVNPDLVATKYPLLSAAWFFQTHNLFDKSTKGATDVIVREVTMVVNGGTNGLEDRIKYFKKYHPLLQ